jgi:anti-sigma factor RsiW
VTPAGCPSEAVLAVHADGELPPAETRSVGAHLASCPRCAALVDALRGESRLLARILEEGPAPAATRGSLWADLLTTGVLLLAAIAGFQAFFGWLGGLGQESPLGLDARSLVVSALFDTVIYVLREGASMLTPLFSAIGLVALVVATALVGVAVRRRATAGLLLIGALVFLAAPARAFERRVARADHQEITVPAGETLDDSLFAAGETVSIDGIVTGNVIACAQRVIVRGTVKGDLIVGGQRVDLAGTVEGNVISFSQTLSVRGPVGKSLHSLGEHVSLDREGRVEGDVIALAGVLDFDGRGGRDLLAFGGPANLRGEVARNVSSWTDRLRVDGPARIGGDLTARAKRKGNVTIDPAATVGGKSDVRIETKRRVSRYARPSFYVWRLIWLAAAFLTGLLLHTLFPSLLATRLEGGASILRTFGIGFVAFLVAPAAGVIVALTVVGLPVALLALAVWGAGLYLSSIFVGVLVGYALLGRGEGPKPGFAVALLLGLAVVSVAVHMPYMGTLLSPLVTLFGMGVGVVQAGRAWKAARAA